MQAQAEQSHQGSWVRAAIFSFDYILWVSPEYGKIAFSCGIKVIFEQPWIWQKAMLIGAETPIIQQDCFLLHFNLIYEK